MNEIEEIVNALSDEQKISFICSSLDKEEKIYNTGINTINFKNEKISNVGSLYQAAISLNDSLIRDYISNLYKESKDVHIANLDEKTNSNLNSISISPYLNGHFLSLYVKSLEDNNVDTAFIIPETNNNIDRAANINKVSKDIYDYPEYFISSDFLDKPRFSTYRFKNQLVINSNDIKKIVKCLNNGYTYAICNLNVKNLLIKSLRDYDYYKKELKAQHITASKIVELQNEGLILNREILDKIVYKRIERIHNKNQIKENRISDTFIDYSELTIMYKNDGLLPLKDEKVTIIGSFSRENELNIDVLEASRKYNLSSNQFCHGYKMDDSFSDALLEEAVEKSLDTICLVYVGTNDLNNPNIPDNQIKLLEKLKENGRKIICVCYKYQYFDKRLLNYANAILQISDLNAMSYNIFDIIYGKKSPSGKTLWYTPKDDSLINPSDFRTYLYPFGYGLNYGNLRIADCNILDGYIEFGVVNDSDFESKFCVFLEVEYNEAEKNIKGYTKFSLKGHENSRVSIPISNETFIEYNYDKHCYEIRGGIYNLILSTGDKELLTISIKLVEHVFDTNSKDVLYEKNPDILSKEVEAISHPDLKRKNRFIFVSAFFIYAFTMFFSLAIVFANKGLYTARNILFVLAAISIVFYLIHIFIFIINKPKKVKTKTYQDLFNEMTEFKKNIDIIYPTPIKENKDEDDLIIKTEEEKNQNEKYDDIDSNLATEENLSIEEEEEIKILEAKASARIINPENVTDGFIEYLNSKGLSISPKTIKEIFSSITATKIILLKSNDKLKLERFVSHLQEYIDNEVISIDLKNNNTFNEMIMDSSSDLSRLILNGARNKNNVIFGYVKNATKESFNKTLMPFINKNINNSNINVLIDGKKITVSNNIYLLVEYNCELENDYTVTIDCDLIDVEKNSFNGKIEFLNIDSLLDILRNHQNSIYISEEDFKKFDDLVNQLNSNEFSELSNRTTIDFDKIYPMLVLADISKEDAIDMLLRMRIVPQIKKCQIYKDNRDEVIKIVCRIFNESQIPLSLKELKEEVSHE